MSALKAKYLPHYKIADFERWEGDWEVIHGIPYSMSPSSTYFHQSFGSEIHHLLKQELTKNKCTCKILYELDWRVSDNTVVRPDLMIICNAPSGSFIENTPELIVEILSPGTLMIDRGLKYELYQKEGVKYYLIADLETQSISRYIFQGGKYVPEDLEVSVKLSSCFIQPDWKSVFVNS